MISCGTSANTVRTVLLNARHATQRFAHTHTHTALCLAPKEYILKNEKSSWTASCPIKFFIKINQLPMFFLFLECVWVCDCVSDDHFDAGRRYQE